MEDIKLVPTKILIEELKERFEVFVVSGIQTNVYASEDTVYRRSWKGEHMRCLGLCNNLEYYINQEQNKMSRPLPPGEG